MYAQSNTLAGVCMLRRSLKMHQCLNRVSVIELK